MNYFFYSGNKNKVKNIFICLKNIKSLCRLFTFILKNKIIIIRNLEIKITHVKS